eukprot:9179545-Pyramimonas_sp.AAC.1
MGCALVSPPPPVSGDGPFIGHLTSLPGELQVKLASAEQLWACQRARSYEGNRRNEYVDPLAARALIR